MNPHADIHAHRVLILDSGSQYTQLIARRVREIGVYCEIHPYDTDEKDLCAFNPEGVILSGGPETVTAENTPHARHCVFGLGVPAPTIEGVYGLARLLERISAA